MSLTEVAKQVRMAVSVLAVTLVLILFWHIFSSPIKKVVYKIFPPKDQPNPIYGLLPQLEFPEIKLADSTPTIELSTADGKLPANLPKKLTVYKYEKPVFSYSAGKAAQADADLLGFTSDELITDLKGNVYKWRDKETFGLLEINAVTKEINLTTNIIGKYTNFVPGIITEETASALATQILDQLGRNSDILYQTKGDRKIVLGKLSGSQLLRASLRDAQFARVDFFRKVLDYPILGPRPKEGLIHISLRVPQPTLVALNYFELVYRARPLIPDNSATYPLIPVAQAWKAVAQETKGVIVELTPISGALFASTSPQVVDQIFINKIYLAFYDNPPQDYLQPIYVFEGVYNTKNKPGGTITYYFPAIQGQYIQPPSSLQPTEQPTK